MSDLLFVEASPRKARSFSSTAAQQVLAAYQAARPDARIDHLDLWAEEFPPFDGAALDAKYAILGKQAHTPEQAAAWSQIEAMIARLKAADALLLSVPMWNFNVPYRLKHYIDLVTQPGLTFSFSPETGYRGLVTGKAAFIAYASSGDYRPGSDNPRPDFQKPFLEAWLRFIGVAEIHTLAVQPTIAAPDRVQAAQQESAVRAVELAQTLAARRAT